MRAIDQTNLTPLEKRTATWLASVYGVRMLGLFMILPVFALYATGLEGVTPFLAGVAIGIYGLTQAALQIPLGMLSDRIGRKPVILGGLAVFAIGSVVAALADSVYGVIFGRALQGSGAIAAASLALLADLTRDEVRTRVMAFIGMSVGLSFAIAMVAGPLLNAWIGVSGIFWLTAVLALTAALIVAKAVPTPTRSRRHRDAAPVREYLGNVIRDPQLLRLDLGIFSLHVLLTASWVIIPLQLEQRYDFASINHWKLYLPVLLFSVAAMIPFVLIAEKYRHLKEVFVGAVAVLVIAELMFFAAGDSFWWLVLSLWVFFTAFNLLEALLPSLVAKVSPADFKGTAMGVYTSSQFFGIFIGGALGGWLHGQFGVKAVFLFCAAIAAVWLLVASSMQRPRHLASYVMEVGSQDASTASLLATELMTIPGVAEAVVIAGEGMAYLKVDSSNLDRDALQAFAHSEV